MNLLVLRTVTSEAGRTVVETVTTEVIAVGVLDSAGQFGTPGGQAVIVMTCVE